MKNFQEKVKKSILLPRIPLTFSRAFTVSENCYRDLKIFANSRPSASNFKSFSQSLQQFLLTVGQNNFGVKIPFLLGCKKLYYCGKNCFKKAWKSYHSKECGFLKDTSLEDLEELDFERMVVRTILR